MLQIKLIYKLCVIFLFFCFCSDPNACHRDDISKKSKRPVKLNNVKITDSFWLPKLKVYYEKSIPHSWQYLNSVLKEADGLIKGEPNTAMEYRRWHESNLYKHLEAISYAIHQFGDEQLKARMDSIIKLLAATQRADGYMYIWGMSRDFEPWTNLLSQHQGFVTGHLYEAASFHSDLFNKDLLECAKKSADHSYKIFNEDEIVKGFPAHAGIELGLVELYRRTCDEKYLDLAKEFIERRGKGLNGNNCIDGYFPCSHYQDHLPFNHQHELKGHAVRAIYYLIGIVDIAIETGSKDYLNAAERLWKNVTTEKMSVTGGIGTYFRNEGLGHNYEVPRNSINESCAACGMVNCASKMLRLEANSKHADILEKALYNCVLHGIALDGQSFYYANLQTGDRRRGNFWSCCPPNITRILLGIGKYIYTQTDNEIFVNLYIGNESSVQLKDTKVNISISDNYAWNGEVEVRPTPEKKKNFSICFRIPGWSNNFKLFVNGEKMENVQMVNGYVKINRIWTKKDKVKLVFDMHVKRIQTHPFVFEYEKRYGDYSFKKEVALQRGPFIYAVEGVDNEGQTDFILAKEPDFKTHYHDDMLRGIVTITGKSLDGGIFTAIPYYALANRKCSNSEVWIRQENKKTNREGEWNNILYREYIPAKMKE